MPVSNEQSQPLTTSADIASRVRDFAGCDILAVDTEFNRTSTYRPQLCLVQLAASSGDALIDMIAGADFSPLKTLLGDDPCIKLLHSGKQDLEALQLTLGWLPNRVFDTQIAAGLLGHPPQAGYATLVEKVLGVKLDKSATRTDWSKRPLSDEQLSYAREDVIYLLELYAHLRDQLVAAGRYEWAQEDSQAMLDPALYVVDPAAAWVRLGGLNRLPVPMQARARRIAEWREARAQQADRPRQWVLSDKAIMNIARANPGNSSELGQVEEVPPAVARRQAQPLLAAVAQANEDLEKNTQDLKREPRPEPTDNAALKNLARLVGRQADALGVAPELLATRKELTCLLRGEQDQRVTSGWRREVIGEALLSAV